MIYIGDRALQARKIGARDIVKVYQGDELVWSGRESMRFTLTMTE